MKKALFVTILFLFILALTGCRVADVNPRAAYLHFNFPSPATYPFLSIVAWKSDECKDAYVEINQRVATVDCHIYNPTTQEWDIPIGYDLSYSLTGDLFPLVKKYEYYENNKMYSDKKIIILPDYAKDKILIKLIVRARNDWFQSRYYIHNLNLSSKNIIRENEAYLLFLDYTIYYPFYTINLPAWDKWPLLK